MPNYIRAHAPGGTFFFTILAYDRRPLFADESNRLLLKSVLAEVMAERRWTILAAAILQDHLHFLWQLPPDDSDYAWRIGRMKARFTQQLTASKRVSVTSAVGSRRTHREADVWPRRFYEHIVRDQDDFNQHLDYIP